MKRSAVVIGVVASVACWCATALAAPAPLFPLRDGATWKLTDERGAALGVRSSRSGAAYMVRGLPGLGPVRLRASGRDIQAWDGQGARWAPFLRLGAAAGTRYRVDLRDEPLWRSMDVTSRPAPASAPTPADGPSRSSS